MASVDSSGTILFSLIFSFFKKINRNLFKCILINSSIQSAVSDAGLSRAGIAAAAVAVPLVAIGGLALLSPLALGRKKRDLSDSEGTLLCLLKTRNSLSK